MKKLVASIVALLFAGIVSSTTSAQTVDKDAGAPLATQSHQNCPSDMVEIEGDYCPDLQVQCLYNVDIDGKRIPKHADLTWACGEYKYPTVCRSAKTVHMHYCIDKYEWPNKEGEIPQDWMTWYDAKRATEAAGKRLCTAREWTLAAEGPDRKPVPYGNGYHRDSTACNFDRHYSEVTETQAFKDLGLTAIDVFRSRTPNDAMSKALRMFLVPSGSMPRCVSDYGVYDMAGNIDEWVVNPGAPEVCPRGQKCYGFISGLKGGHVWHVRNASRPSTDAHGPTFGWYETGTRACKDIE
jgi:formylglycine-generating enzyme